MAKILDANLSALLNCSKEYIVAAFEEWGHVKTCIVIIPFNEKSSETEAETIYPQDNKSYSESLLKSAEAFDNSFARCVVDIVSIAHDDITLRPGFIKRFGEHEFVVVGILYKRVDGKSDSAKFIIPYDIAERTVLLCNEEEWQERKSIFSFK